MSHMRSRATRWFLILVGGLLATVGSGIFAAPVSAALVPSQVGCANDSSPGQVIDCTPSALLLINGTDVREFNVVPSIIGSGKSHQILLGSAAAPVRVDNLAQVVMSVTTNADPFVAYAFAVTNLTAGPLDFDVTVTAPFVGGPYTQLSTSHSGSTTDSGASPNGNVTIGVGAPGEFVHQPLVNGAPVDLVPGLPIDGLNPGCSVGTAPGGSGNCPPTGLSATAPITTGETGTFGVRVHFTLSPEDIYTLNGRVELFPTQVPGQLPEPATLLLIAGGAVVLAVHRRRARISRG